MMYYDKLIFDLSTPERKGYSLPNYDIPEHKINPGLCREDDLLLPEVSELETLRHYTNVSFKNFGIEKGFYPLGSCTMKYNPKINQDISNLPAFHLHPYQPIKSVQGNLEIYYETQRILSELSGLDEFTLNPYAGAHGELVGLMIMKKYHHDRGDFKRTKVIVPDSAHGTNPASAAVAGFDIIEVKSNVDGTVHIEDLETVLSDEIAGIMLTNPNTVGIFEKDILEISRLVHEAGGLLYYDGANLNPILGVARPGDMGFDIMHINLHKTFSTPHGGGGPGSGPVGVKEFLRPYLPKPVVVKTVNGFDIEMDNDTTIGQISHFYGNFGVVIKAYTYLLTVGKEHFEYVGKLSVLNANYIKESLKDVYELPIESVCKHEFVFNGLRDKTQHVTTLDIAKRLLDYDVHPPTIYFPLVIKEALMIEPPETESKQTVDHFINVMRTVAEEARTNPELVKGAPYTTVVKRLDEAKAARQPIVKYRDLL
ncbi:aminomethyl-transferring glycine dehydrogenase subunit GcvPB [Candidatus Xianfuyuplasma coldseepsis]|uniref:Probable glycine dehydrogenase (decarboxylating) subunit 2 n=1 Tax=Candidatus Xianfuyuplasma coldseepsis TaxID=2782163 RepID=A0A7L7KTI6_9MOLU|nr:aminomethyl-transferring glycine dehydrogenase subunit GcvPB [Xianfuyuplasma coldseepsis]QMS85935.1 glycine dehydrogenase subunit 2 [Xianfuyuplasma coldseepsis]